MDKIIKNNQFEKIHKSSSTYQQQKMNFLDNLQPDDFRNGESFNQAEVIIDNINEALRQAIINKKNSGDFITKSLARLFREDSLAIEKAMILSEVYLLQFTPFSTQN